MTQEELYQLPKVELHCHLDGSLPLATIRQLADRQGIAIPEDDANLRLLVSAPQSCGRRPVIWWRRFLRNTSYIWKPDSLRCF